MAPPLSSLHGGLNEKTCWTSVMLRSPTACMPESTGWHLMPDVRVTQLLAALPGGPRSFSCESSFSRRKLKMIGSLKTSLIQSGLSERRAGWRGGLEVARNTSPGVLIGIDSVFYQNAYPFTAVFYCLYPIRDPASRGQRQNHTSDRALPYQKPPRLHPDPSPGQRNAGQGRPGPDLSQLLPLERPNGLYAWKDETEICSPCDHLRRGLHIALPHSANLPRLARGTGSPGHLMWQSGAAAPHRRRNATRLALQACRLLRRGRGRPQSQKEMRARGRPGPDLSQLLPMERPNGLDAWKDGTEIRSPCDHLGRGLHSALPHSVNLPPLARGMGRPGHLLWQSGQLPPITGEMLHDWLREHATY